MKYTIGIDEVGRGALAGPVMVGVFLCPNDLQVSKKPPLRDSKKLSGRQREVWESKIRQLVERGKVRYKLARVSPKVIDKINISRATNLASERALKRLLAEVDFKKEDKVEVVLDGGLKIKKLAWPVKTVVGADRKFKAVMMAAIMAKVTRDRYMRQTHKIWPEYEFNRHVGYGTKVHIIALGKHGPCDIHRRSYLTKIRIN